MRTWWQTRERCLVSFNPQRNGGPALRLFHGDPAFSGAEARWSDTVRPQGQWSHIRTERGLPMFSNVGPTLRVPAASASPGEVAHAVSLGTAESSL